MNNYWLDRVKKEEANTHIKALDLVKELEIEYKKAFESIKNSINDLEVKIKNDENNIDFLEANKLISDKDRKDLHSKLKNNLKSYRKFAKSIDYKEVKDGNAIEIHKLRELRILGNKARLSRLEATKLEINAELEMLARKKEYMLTNHLEDVYEDTYYKTAYFESNITGTEKIINKLDKSTINAAIKKVWVADGKNFSDRIWTNTTRLAQELTKDLTIAIITGKSNLAKDLTKRYNVSMAQANRLVQTETSAIRNQATMKRYEDSGIDKYQVIATLDTHTSDICKSMDKKIFETKDKQIGVNYPPFHINCRSTTIAYFPEIMETTTRKSKLANGTEVEVQHNMNYEKWHDKYIKSSPEQLKYEKMEKNKGRDLEQYNKYRDVLGKENVPKTFEKFVNMKYNELDRWELLKHYKKSIQNNDLTRLVNFNDYEMIKDTLEKELIGFKTKDGIEIKGISKHFIDRHIGVVFSKKKYSLGEYEMRKGVDLDDIKDTLTNSINVSKIKIDELGRKSKKYSSKLAQISINTKTNELIQCNVRRKNKKKKTR